MKKSIMLIVIILLTLSGCRMQTIETIIESTYYEESTIESSNIDSSNDFKPSGNSVLTEKVISNVENTETEIAVSVSKDEAVVPTNQPEEIVNPITPPVTNTENDIVELPDFEETTSDIENTENYNTAHIAVKQENYYQYSQMNEKGKQIYTLLKSAVLSCKNLADLSIIGVSTNDAMSVIHHFRADYPQYFWLYNSVAFTYNSSNDMISCVFLFYTDGASVDSIEQTSSGNYRVVVNADRQKIAERQREVNAQIENIIGKIDADWSDYRKERYIHDYIAVNMTYDKDAAQNPYISENVLKPAFDIYSGFIGKTGVCEAYSKMFQVLCYAVGINANQVTGVGHMWNTVLIDGEWYQIDVTWDDLDTSNPMNNGIRYNYFNLSSSKMAADGYHTPDGTLYVPECISNKYLLKIAS